ncbi:hypothetical protein [Streptomyces anulatus]|uniref:hypothetical protein n=1 Tax=Streptomyces anulatus TaxID=1892 RepID=UPI000AB160E6|nr:hypothetical protein [Streptomyces anulatus]
MSPFQARNPIVDRAPDDAIRLARDRLDRRAITGPPSPRRSGQPPQAPLCRRSQGDTVG